MPRLLKTALVTVGIAIFLLVLLFPVFQNVQENVHYPATGCMSNMKQIGLALAQYSQDYGDLPPEATASHPSGWRQAIYPYVKSTSVFRCPSDAYESRPDSPENLPKSYAANQLSSSAAYRNLAQTISVVDARGEAGEDWEMTSPAFLPGTGRTLYAHFPRHPFYERPAGKLNLLFADGHVKRLTPMDTLTPINLWTRDNAPFTGSNLTNARAILKHAEEE